MKVKNRLKRRYVLFALSAVLFLFGATNVSALTKNITVTDVAIKDKSGTVAVEEPVLSDNKITSNVTFNQKDDFVAFELSIKNGESEKYKIESIEDNNTNKNIQVEYAYSEDFISTNESGKLTVKMTYKNALINVDKISINDLTIRVFLISEDGKSDEIIINPTTSDALPYYLAIAVAAVAGLVLLAKKKKVKGIKIGGVVIALSVLLIPLAVLAKEKYETQIEFTNIDIIGEFETYNITINPGNGDEILVVPVQYGNKLESLPANPSKDGYDFDKWVDGNGNTVTSDTVITGPITVEAQYTIKHYAINYDLDGGSLPDGKTNPSGYTIEDEITVNNPIKQGYTFTGWSGTGIDGKTTNLVIPAGSKDERSYVANYSANKNTPYRVTHRYQNLDDLSTYTEEDVTEYGETDKTIPAPRQEKTGFATPAVQNVTINADGSASVTYIYDRETYLYSVTDRTYITSDSTANGSYPYETSITVKAQERAGYTFAWNDGDTNYERTFELTGTVSLTPVYTAKTNTKYVVKHYKQKLTLDGYEIADTQNLTGTTDAPISPAVNTYTGFKSPAVQHTTIAGDGSTEVIYYYDREMYAFSFNNNENVTSTKPADSYPYETVITLTANIVDGKTFSKWSNEETDNPLTITLTGDLTIEPVYTNNTVTVTFDTGDGSEVASQTINYGEKATRPAENPTKKNYLFYDWYTTDSYETVFDFNTEITTDTTIYARFVPSAFPTVFEQEEECIFNGADGVLEGENCAYANGENKYIDTDVQLYIAENHDKDYEIGFTIVSYNSDENVKQATFMNTKLEGNNYPGVVFRKYDNRNNLDLCSRRTATSEARRAIDYADEMTVKIYRITNKTTGVQEIFSSINGEEKIKLNDLSQFNPEFNTSVWFGAAPVNTSANTVQRILVGTLSNMYIKLGSYEEPEGLTYTVNFDANGGSVSPTSITRDKGDAVGELPTPTNVPSGKEFDGWYTDLGEKGVKVDSSYTPNTGTTLYAKYKDAPKLTVTFDTDGGSSIDSQEVVYGGKATRPSTDPTKVGYKFDNWYTSSAYDTVFDFDNTAITRNTTIYAKFDVLTCKTFATDSWSTIRDNLASDSSYYAVGCEKEVELDMDDDSTPESYTVRLANTSTPEVCSTEGYSQTACGTVIEFVDIVTKRRMNPSYYNTGGWRETEMVTWLNNDFYNKLPSDLRDIIIPTYPIVSGRGKLSVSNDITNVDIDKNKMYLLTQRETNAVMIYENRADENRDTRILDYYIHTEYDINKPDPHVKRTVSGTRYPWWLRSATTEDSYDFCLYDQEGTESFNNANIDYGVAPAFRIGIMPEFSASFDTDGGSSISDQTITYGEKATRPSTDPAKEGYIFDNWYTSNTHDTLFDFDNTIITKDTTIYAFFIEPCRDFSTASWSTIRDNLESNPNYYAVGCEKEVELDMDNDSAPESYTVRLANTSTPNICYADGYSKTACGAVIEFVTPLATHRMNPNDGTFIAGDGNSGGWEYSEMRSYINNDIFNILPDELRNVIVDTSVDSGHGIDDEANFKTIDKMYLLAPNELTDEKTELDASRTRILDYYASNNSSGYPWIRKNTSGTAVDWWLRSCPYKYGKRAFNSVYRLGGTNYAGAAAEKWVVPAFRISEGVKPFAVASFNTDGGTLIESQTFESSGNAIRPTTDPVKNGFLFDDWYTDNSYTTPFDFVNTLISNDTIIYAHFVDLNLCKTFSEDSWLTIRENLTSDPNYYAIGCEKEVELDMNDDSVPESYTVRLSNTSTPEVCSTEGYSKTSCGLVIEFVDIVSARKMNYDATNARGWSNTALVWWINSTLYDKLPAELQNVIIPTYPIVSGSGKSTTSPDITDADVAKNKLYLLSTREIGFNSTDDNKRDETTDTRTLDYYKMNNNNYSRIKRDLNGVTQDWWLRSAEYRNNYGFFYGTYDGGGSMNPSDDSYGVAPAFRIGAN